MKILLVGANKEYSLEHFYFQNLKELNQDVDIFDSKKIIDDYRKLFFNKILLRLGFEFIYNKINNQLIEYVYSSKPNVIIIFKGMEIKPSTIDELKSKGIFLVNYNPDHPFMFSGKGSGNSNVTNSLSKFNLHITYAENIKQLIQDKLNLPNAIIPFGYQFSEKDFEKIKNHNEINRICFIGYGDYLRAEKIKFLIKNKLPVTVIGTSWGKFVKPSKYLEIIDKPIYGLNYYRTLRSYTVQLNLLRPHNKGNHNMRFFEAAISGSIMLVSSNSEISKFFSGPMDVFSYKNDKELLDKCTTLLNIDKVKRDKIRDNVRENIINGKHSYFDRSKNLLEVLKHRLS